MVGKLKDYTVQYQNIRLLIPTYYLRFIPKGVAEASQIFLRNTYILPK
jgi:hypothetical protein